MYNVPQYKPEIRLISNIDGVVGVYPDYDTFIDQIEYFFVESHVVTTFRGWPGRWIYYWKWGETYPKYIVRDIHNSVFTPTEILHDLRKKRRGTSKWSRYLATKYDFIYRETPVPHTGKRGRGFHCWYKTPKTTQELRWNEAYKGYTRGKRHKGYLPTSWDDYPRGDIDNRKNWKSCRKTQWK
ncbi:hypothetical protein LCGC14_2439820 [marine sediment metagenome]|uniref:Uncharacterized protein n=1 Tax=marine sediment metagenome TaxID=412755 RepID=A0A0F9BJG5_9ZZZZ